MGGSRARSAFVSLSLATLSLAGAHRPALAVGSRVPLRPRSVARSARATPGAKLWAKRYNGVGQGRDDAYASVVSPDGSAVFVTGRSEGSNGDGDYATVAYDASTGAKLWAKRFDGSANNDDVARAVGVSPDGAAVFVTGYSWASPGQYEYVTVAYDASTGAKLWGKRHSDVFGALAYALGVSSDGSMVFVTGAGIGSSGLEDYVTVAYNATTGAQLWVSRYDGPAGLEDSALALGVSPDGSTVFVTGDSCKDYPCGDSDYATVAYGALAGNQLWASRYDGPADVNSLDDTSAIGVTPDGSTVIVTGSSIGSTNDYDYATVAYAAAGGGQLWVRRYDGPASGDDNAHGLGVSPDGLRAFVTGASGGGGSGYSYLDYATIAYDVYTGAQVWVKRYDGAGHGEDQATALGVSASGPTVLVTGYSDTGFGTDLYDYATVAYDASTGTKLWAKRYNGPGNGADQAHALAMASGGSTVFVTGTSLGSSSGFDYATVAYSVI